MGARLRHPRCLRVAGARPAGSTSTSAPAGPAVLHFGARLADPGSRPAVLQDAERDGAQAHGTARCRAAGLGPAAVADPGFHLIRTNPRPPVMSSSTASDTASSPALSTGVVPWGVRSEFAFQVRLEFGARVRFGPLP